MPDLLLELFSEEIPARMQAQAAADLRRLVTDGLVARDLTYEGAKAYATPRRLALHVAGLPARQRDVREERKGPRVGSPDAAIQGFLKSAGLASIADAKIERDPKKGEFYVAVLERPGRPTVEILADLLPEVIRGFPWPKSMRWGAASATGDALRWVRPLQRILCTFASEVEEPQVVDFAVGDIRSGNTTSGHRFLSPGTIEVRRFDDYVASLGKAHVVLDAERRADIVAHDARDLAFARGLELVEDPALLSEVAGLVEWPVVLTGEFEPEFLAIPPEVIRLTIRANQKCFVLRRPETGALANTFVLVSNIEAPDGGAVISAGNGRVVRARLSDAKFFWETDLRVRLEDRLPKLDSVVYHEKLGTQGERVRRIAALARELAPCVGADPDLAERAARLAKADLGSEMVGEFPELQGTMGRYYATAQGEDPAVAAAIGDHYRPQGPSDGVPRDPVAVAVAIADKLDTLVGFWAIGETPTGSKDPYALRRAALGIIRIVLENELRVRLTAPMPGILYRLNEQDGARFAHLLVDELAKVEDRTGVCFSNAELDLLWQRHSARYTEAQRQTLIRRTVAIGSNLLAFMADRLKVHLREQGARHDLIDAVFGLPGQDDMLMIVRRVEALGEFLDSDDGRNLLVGYRRAANILRAEERKDGAEAFETGYDPARLVLPEETDLAAALDESSRQAGACIAEEDFAGAMRALSRLRAPVDAFFDKVTVNADDPAVRLNRLRLLSGLRRSVHTVADFSRISEGAPAKAKSRA